MYCRIKGSDLYHANGGGDEAVGSWQLAVE
jgi:hypothetical protein